ncbi:IcmK protein [Legionella quinlivanii]|uniref:IcmK protein n=1 Tax=Legionella quinlivanii TaxID=45073 RepID=A0A0W0XLH1_9GAMM|nr:DotH/IcmK family type IV secretion protein [Legionella quinlivanii]KTD45439.1 IcmK protein [Legionella quinlivanii]MCW8451273.1 DotH/IcmK family type IV secretion protein [Legionella quinlivanii]SEG33630.1 intracellular multiplication protein IcmK [Legionella quinlivanii DSM 21216]STY10530.1 IcmK protein [Legionella quinlivanii]
MQKTGSHKLLKYGLTAVFAFNSVITASYAAEQSDSAQQALQQLRMLQQKLSAQQGGNSSTSPQLNLPLGNTAGTAAQSTTQTQQTTTVVNATTGQQISGPPKTPGAPDQQVLTANDNDVIDKQAFEGVLKQKFPLTPEQIIRLRHAYQANDFAETSTAGTPPKPTATSQFVNLSPGSTPPVIRLSQGFVSSLVFLDSTGAPWPISAYDLGDPASFNIQWDKTSNTLMIQALRLYNYGNLAVRLRGLNTPVMLTLIPGQKAVDYRVDLRIQGYGPNAKSMPMEEGIPPAVSDILLHVLDGVPPDGSTRLIVSGGDARAWLLNDKMYVRTNLTILSPGWIGSMTSADGMHAYEMQRSPVLLVSWHGKVMQLKVEGL